jgi:hypothetical protein
MIKQLVQQYVAKRPHKPGDTVQFGWFVFRIADDAQPPEIESLDFKQVASFTKDFSAVEQIHGLQKNVLVQSGRVEQECVLWHSAIVSLSYSPGREDVILKGDAPVDPNDSGWYVGVFDEQRNMADAASFTRRSLYELTIRNMRMAPYWLLPFGTIVTLATGEIK